MMQSKIRKIMQEAVGHGIEDRKRKCDCLWCRDGGTFDTAISLITQAILEEMPEPKKQTVFGELKGNGDYYETGKVMGYNACLSEIKHNLTSRGEKGEK